MSSTMTDGAHDATPVAADGLLIDPTTGEIIAGSTPGGESEFEQLTRVCREAQQQIKEAEAVLSAARAALLRLLTNEGLSSMRTSHGTASVVTKTTRTGRPERVEEIVRRFELAREQVAQVWMCASALDAKKLDALVEAGALPAAAMQDLIDEKRTTFVQVTASRSTPV